MHLEIEQIKLLKNIIYNKKKIIINIVSITLIFILSFSISLDIFAAEVTNPENILNPADNDEVVDTNAFIYKKYDEKTKKELEDNVINYDEIDDLIHEYNPNVLSWWNSYKNNKTATEVYDDYMDSYNRIMDSADSSESDAAAARLYAQAYSMKMLADNNTNDSIINFWNYQIDEIKLCLDTKKKFINYYITNYNEKIAELNVAETRRLANAANVKRQVGLETELTYLQSNKNADDAVANLDLAKTNHDVAEKNLKIACGQSISNDVVVGDMPDARVNINAINLLDDIEIAKLNNIYLKIYNRALKNSNTDEMKNYNQILIDYANEAIASSVKNYYDVLNNQVSSLTTRETSSALMDQQLSKAKADLANGRISDADYQTSVYNAEVSKIQVDIQLLNVLSAYEDYRYAVYMGIAEAKL